MDLNKITKAHVNIRDARAELKKKFDAEDRELREKQAKLEAAMLAHLNECNIDSVRTESGTFYRQEDIIPSGADWDAFYRWIVDNDAFDAIERRIKKAFIKEYMEAHEGAIPPGVNVYREYAVRVRRS